MVDYWSGRVEWSKQKVKQKMTKTFAMLAALSGMASMCAVAADFNVRDCGAKGDGQAKDTAAIQQAIDV